MYSSQPKSIREDLSVLQRICSTEILQNHLNKKQHCAFKSFFLTLLVTNVVIKYSLTTLGCLTSILGNFLCVTSDFGGLSFGGWKDDISVCHEEPANCIYWDSFIFYRSLFTCTTVIWTPNIMLIICSMCSIHTHNLYQQLAHIPVHFNNLSLQAKTNLSGCWLMSLGSLKAIHFKCFHINQ